MTEKSDGIDLSRRKILGGLTALGAASAATGAGTFALFSDTESSSGNQIQAGTLDLEVGNEGGLQIGVQDKPPGWSTSYSANVDNTGSIDGNLRVEVNVTGTGDGTNPESEESYPQSHQMKDEVWVKLGFGSTNVIDTKTSLGTAEMLGEIDALQPLSASGSTTLDIEVGIDSDAPNDVQGDSITFEVVVSLLQKDPITVSDTGNSEDIQAAINSASPGDTIKLQGDRYDGQFIIDTPNVGLYGQGATIDVGKGSVVGIKREGIGIAANDVTLQGVYVAESDSSTDQGRQGIVVNPDSHRSNNERKSGVALMDITVDGGSEPTPSDDVVTIDYSDNIVANDVKMVNNPDDCFTVWYSNNCRVENATLNNNGDNGAYFRGDGNAILHSEVKANGYDGVYFKWADDEMDQTGVVDGVVSKNNGNGGNSDVTFHDAGSTDTNAADDSKLVKNLDTFESSAEVGLRLAAVDRSELQVVNSRIHATDYDSGSGYSGGS